MLGTINTFVLLTSSLTMALAVHAGQTGDRKGQVRYLLLTMLLGTTFLGIKAYEYYEEYEKRLIPGLHFNSKGILADPRRALGARGAGGRSCSSSSTSS